MTAESDPPVDTGAEPAAAPPQVASVWRLRRWPFIVLAALPGALVLFWVWQALADEDGPSPPLLTTVIERPLPGAPGLIPTPWFEATDIDVVGTDIYVLDGGNNRVLRLDRNGAIQAVLCESGECGFLLDGPEALLVRPEGIYVANTNRGEVTVISPDNDVLATYAMPAGEVDPRPAGLAVGPSGELFVSDAANGRVARFRADGDFEGFVGPPDEPHPFAGPQGLDVDAAGNLYVAERDLGRIQKMSVEGRPLTSFSMVPENPEISTPSDVTLTPTEDFVLMADQKRAIIHVFSISAGYRGIAGLLDATRIDSPSAVRDPRAIAFADGSLYVLDGQRGVEVFSFDPEYWAN